VKRRRIWVELLPPEELGRPTTRALLARYALEPIMALPPSRQTPAMRTALSELAADGIPIGIWPLLHDADGYWLSTHNAATFMARVDEALAFLAEIPVRTMAIDLEPPLAISRALNEGDVAGPLIRALFTSMTPAVRSARHEGRARLMALTTSLRARGIETLAAILPPVLLDLDARHRPVQAMLSTPLDPSACDVVCPMMYTTMIAPLFPGRGMAIARHLLALAARRLVARRGTAGTSIGLGCVGLGKLGDEPIYADVAALEADVRAATLAGATDLALFSLEGALGRREPEAWLRAFAEG